VLIIALVSLIFILFPLIKIEAQPAQNNVSRKRLPEPAPEYIIRGKVIAEDDRMPITGAEVEIHGANIKTTTDSNGKFQITTTVPGYLGNLELIIKSVGFETERVTVSCYKKRRYLFKMRLNAIQRGGE